MDNSSKFALFLLLLLPHFAINKTNASPSKKDFLSCKNGVKNWASSSSVESEGRKDKHKLGDLLFFLHIPRTGGRSYFHCFLKKLYPNSQQCPRSYDRLRFDPSKHKCKLMASHHDYSMMYKLPVERASVVTIQRNPIDRVFSAYEFSIEVAARFLIHSNLSSARKMEKQWHQNTKVPSTLDIWPWKFLVPWMREDLFARRDTRKNRDHSFVKTNDSYNVKDVVMPLNEFIRKPIVRDIIHNGATFQIAGLTNNSYIEESHKVRHCVLKYQTLGNYVLDVAKKRLDEMLYVGLTENHKESVAMFADVVGTQVMSHLLSFNSTKVNYDNKSEQNPPFMDTNNGPSHQNSITISKGKIEAANETMRMESIIKNYSSCISKLRTSQAHLRTSSLKKIAPVNFTKEVRNQVPDRVIKEIVSLNSLDLELYEYAKDIFIKQLAQTHQKSVSHEKLESILNGSLGVHSWEIVSSLIFMLTLSVMLIVNGRRRAFKLKL